MLTAGYDGAGTQAQQPATYLRFNEPARFPASNNGTLGDAAAGSLVLTTNDIPGPVTPGFESSNLAVPLNGTNAWMSLNNPPGLLISGQITLEAWINPAAIQGDPARIISHGPATPTVADLSAFPDLTLTGSLLDRNEVFLRIDGSGANYVAGSSDGTNSHTATFAVPAGDLGGGNWIHLVGTYDGTNWTLFRNGSQVATAADTVGALPVIYGEWAFGSTGMGWSDDFAGAIDEVAIYNHALSADRVQAHYAAASSAARPSVSISLAAGNVTLTWTTGTLQQADQITGTFADVPGATSAYTVPANALTKFYRLRL